MAMAELHPEPLISTYSHSTLPPSLRTETECMWSTLAVPLCQTSLTSGRTPEGVNLSLKGYWSTVFTSAQAPHLSSYLPLSPSCQQEQLALRSQPFSQSLGGISRGQWRGKEKMLAWVKWITAEAIKGTPRCGTVKKTMRRTGLDGKCEGMKETLLSQISAKPSLSLSPTHASVSLSAARRPPPLEFHI